VGQPVSADGPVRALVGPTGSGKTELALAAAERLGAEIVAVDAFTVYAGMDAGTAKPSPDQRIRVPHHMLDVLDPSEEADVAWFQRAARQAVTDVHARGRPALLVGGSGLYFRAVADPLVFPPTDASVRGALLARYRHRAAAAHAQLAAVDPAAAEKIEPDNLRRSVRALEVWQLTGRRFSDYRVAWDDYASVWPQLAVVGVDRPRDELARRLDARVEAMIGAAGDGPLVAECRRLAGRRLSTTASRAIGYAEVFAYLAGDSTLATAIETTKTRTRRYARRQRRWFANDPRLRWVAPSRVSEELAEVSTG
jgi:tRNA dimethylallyltransferase